MVRNIWRKLNLGRTSGANLDERALRRRKSMVTGMVALTVLILFGFILGSGRFLQTMGTFLEDELGRRLLSVASLTARTIEESSTLPSFLRPEDYDLLSPRLQEILTDVHLQNQLQGVYLVDDSLRAFAGSPDIFQSGERLFFLEEDSLSIGRAASGLPDVAPMQLVAGNRFKSAYAPVTGSRFSERVVGIVVVQANAGFFDLIGQFQNGLILGGLVSGSLALLFSMFLFWAIRSLIKTHESLRRNERLAAMGQMAATVAHEIRNPLGIIKSSADVLRSKYDSADAPDELFDFIPSEVRRLNRLVSDFLAFARDRELVTNASDLKQTISKTLSTLQDEINEANVTLDTEMDDVPPVNHDEDAINQVMLNLTLNAIQAMNGGGLVSVRLKNESHRAQSVVRVEVEDTGCGLDADPEA
ncbi:hypothetical protein MJD09_24955, partial [bacterium]|nr:hypothetical protein [bacterium]